MLDLDHGQNLMEDLWEMVETKVSAHQLGKDFFAQNGAADARDENQRAYHRYFMRGKAILKRGNSLFGGFTKDVSRQGIGFLSPVQLLPKERVKLRLPVTELGLEVTRCRRIDKDCFDCGAKFVL
jgi:hypothetical protein